MNLDRINVHLIRKDKLPNSSILLEIKVKKFILDDVIYKLRDDGLVIEGTHSKTYVEYFPWFYFESYTENIGFLDSIGNKNKIKLRLKPKFEIRGKRNLFYSMMISRYIPFRPENKQLILNILKERFENTRIDSVNNSNIILDKQNSKIGIKYYYFIKFVLIILGLLIIIWQIIQ